MWNDFFLEVATIAANNGRKVLLSYEGKALGSELKADLSPVTAADKACEKELRLVIESAFPEHGIYGEETGRTNPDAPYQWVLDPIDGTRAFIAGYATYTILIALCYEGKPILGIIDQPTLKQRWTGFPHPSPPERASYATFEHFYMATTSIEYFDEKQFAKFDKLRGIAKNTVFNGDAYAYAMLASGRLGVVLDVSMKPYDYLALVPVIENAGGVITDWKGKPLTLDSKGDVVASANKELHQKILKVLK